MRRSYDPPVTRVCTYCHTSFTLPAAWVRKGGGAFCSRDCKAAAERTLVTLICKNCLNSFTTLPAYQRKGIVLYCSKACYNMSRQLPLEARWWKKVLKTDTCWLWQGMHTGAGYGTILSQGKGSPVLMAHRVGWTIGHGPISEDIEVLHHCDTRLCVNFEKCLFLGTQADNIIDMISKGRGWWQK